MVATCISGDRAGYIISVIEMGIFESLLAGYFITKPTDLYVTELDM